MISEHAFLRTLSPAYLKILADCAEEQEFRPGEIIFREGERADRLYLIERGKVRLESEAIPAGGTLGQELQDLGPQDVLGWSWLLPPSAWQFQARATEPTRALTLNGSDLLGACDRNHEFGYELMNRLSQVLIRRLQAAQEQLAKLHPPRAIV